MKKIIFKYVSLLLFVCISTGLLSNTAYALTPNSKQSVAPSVVNSIFSKYPMQISEGAVLSENEISTMDAESELSTLYIKEYLATNNYNENPTSDNLHLLNSIVERINVIENTLKNRGQIFLSPEDAQVLMGENISTYVVGDKPSDTANTQFVATTISNITMSDGTVVPYYYVTAYSKTTSSYMVSMPTIDMGSNYNLTTFAAKVINLYANKIIASVISQIKYFSWLPYELIQSSSPQAISNYTIESVYTSTPRFIWAYSNTFNQYYLEGVTHMVDVADHHVIRSTKNGKSYVDSRDNSRTFYCDNYYTPSVIVTSQYNTNNPNLHLERIDDIKYEDNGTIVATRKVPYATKYASLN